ncbi:MAG TPA: CdaR family protein [Nitrospiria bacterium]
MIRNRLKARLLDNVLIKIISLVFAVILWFYVNSKGVVERDIAVPLEFRNLPANLTIIGDVLDEVNVRVKSRERILRGMAESRIHAVLDLAGAHAGENVYFLDAAAVERPEDVQIERISPRRIRIRTAEKPVS